MKQASIDALAILSAKEQREYRTTVDLEVLHE